MMRIVICFLLLNFCSCKQSNDANNCESAEVFEVVDLSSLAGCQFLLQDNEDRRFEPINLLNIKPDVKAGDVINAKIKVENDLAGICQAGEIVSIICIK